MNTYSDLVRSVISTVRGENTYSSDITDDEVLNMLEHSETVQVTKFHFSPAPATTHHLSGEEATTGWQQLSELYDMDEPELLVRNTYHPSYEIRAPYYSDGMYKGEWAFSVEEDAVWATLNDV